MLKIKGFLKSAVSAAESAGEVIMKNLGTLSRDDIHTKQATDFVTRVDRESEQRIIDIIHRRYPDHRFLGEESLKDSDTGGHRWIIDPLDGTTNFIHGYPVFSVSIALEYEREIILGVILDPSRNELFTAEKGHGAFLNGRQIRICSTTEMKTALITTGFPFRRRDLTDDYLKLFRTIFSRVSDIRRAGSAALDLAYLAAGRCEGFFEIGLGPWDIAAGSILVHEAGGIITDFSGGTDYLLTGNIVAGNPAIHSELLKETQNVFRNIIGR